MQLNLKIVFGLILLLPTVASAASIWQQSAEKGYWFYFSPIRHHLKVTPFVNNPSQKMAHKINCLNHSQWISDCGFVNPSQVGLDKQKAFNFEQKEYLGLMRAYSMYPNDMSVVYQWQRFNNWAISQAMTASYTAQFNLAQHPGLSSAVTNPTSAFGITIIKNIEQDKKQNFFAMLSKTSMLVYFSRSNCVPCHTESTVVRLLARKTGIPVWNASLDGQPLAGYRNYLVAPQTIQPAQILKVGIVPTLFLYLAPSSRTGGGKWIRVATGLTAEDIIETRIVNFVEAYRHAVIVGSKDGSQKYQPNFKILRNNLLATMGSSLDPSEEK